MFCYKLKFSLAEDKPQTSTSQTRTGSTSERLLWDNNVVGLVCVDKSHRRLRGFRVEAQRALANVTYR